MGEPCLDFTSAHYLGLRHPSGSLGAYAELVPGTPAALREPALVHAVEHGFASLVGRERALVFSSMLHFAFDFFARLVRRDEVVLWDRGMYPILRWGLDVARARGVIVRSFEHLDSSGLEQSLGHARGRRSWIVTDGYCPGCGRIAPVAEHARLAARYGATLVVEDTQAVGIFGSEPGPGSRWGRGGGGAARWFGLSQAPLLVVASLSKALGAALCVAAGPAELIADLRRRSEVRVHTTPPCTAALRAALRALALNRSEGDARRARLLWLVERFQRFARGARVPVMPGCFPIQRCLVGDSRRTLALYRALLARNIASVPQESRCGAASSLSFVLNSDHELEHIGFALTTLSTLVHADSTRGRGTQRLDLEGRMT